VTAPTLVVSNAPKKAWEALLALGTPKLKLATDTHVPDQDANDFSNDITNEAAGTGYTAGGYTLTTVTVTLDTATNTITITCDDVTGISVSCRWGYFIVDTGTAATSPIIAYTDFSEGLGGNVTLTGTNGLDTDGFLQDVVA
jgi:hypothetical protein